MEPLSEIILIHVGTEDLSDVLDPVGVNLLPLNRTKLDIAVLSVFRLELQDASEPDLEVTQPTIVHADSSCIPVLVLMCSELAREIVAEGFCLVGLDFRFNRFTLVSSYEIEIRRTIFNLYFVKYSTVALQECNEILISVLDPSGALYELVFSVSLHFTSILLHTA